MTKKMDTTVKLDNRSQRKALASPLRLEILGLFTHREPLAVADMAGLMGRTAGSLYHHVGILERAGLLLRIGTRRKGKRHEALFLPAARRLELEAAPGDGDATALVVKTMASAFRMAERDLEAALRDDRCSREGPGRNLHATRIHLRSSPEFLARLNEHLRAIDELLMSESAKDAGPSPDDQHLSLTIALLPLRGRSAGEPPQGG